MDEFTVPAEKSRLLEQSRGRIEGLFEVRLALLGAQGDWRPALAPSNASARIWVQLAGCSKAVSSAKVRGRERAGDAEAAGFACPEAGPHRLGPRVGGRKGGEKPRASGGSRNGAALAGGCVPGARESPAVLT